MNRYGSHSSINGCIPSTRDAFFFINKKEINVKLKGRFVEEGENPMILGNPIARGNTAKIYLSDNKIVKIFNDHLPDTESIKEANKQSYAYSCGLPVPKILEVTKINGEQAIIMEYFKGETLGDLMFKNKEQAEYYMNVSIDMQLKVHNIIPEGIESMYDKLYSQIETVNNLDKRQKSYILNKLGSLSYELMSVIYISLI
ncbi:hypothetical protein PQ478_21450 (plasmid) [Alkalihalophilus pseudofirmus]|uniref:hypothetical protein n=1 Tax=Alkalihalophilus pseudofirmus TaxID=79885 RepID=UPI00259BEBDA|nr:hypothetical protein [Alkalihalophilus pseudofirmus]WEG19255.1 hypothetical protein PQ478_21450 [Alkalihalophilus pseudofirmus]